MLFCVAALVLSVVAAIWGLLWHISWQIYTRRMEPDKVKYYSQIITWGLSLTYGAAFFALMAVAFAGLFCFVKSEPLINIAIGLIAGAVYMMIVQTFQSLVSSFYKFFRHKSFNEPYKVIPLRQLKIAMYVIVSLGVSIFVWLELYLFGLLK